MIGEIVAVTGHRPQRLSLEDGYWIQDEFDRLMSKLDPRVAISGMALGADTWWANASLYHMVPLHAYIPFRGQETRWRQDDQIFYRQLLDKAAEVVTVCRGYHPGAFGRRNEAMVDACGIVVAAWNGKTHGGTWNCLEYARKVGRPIIWVDVTGRKTVLQKAV